MPFRIYFGNQAGGAPAATAPFVQTIWTSPARTNPKGRPDWEVNLRVLFAPNPDRPFVQHDWPPARRARPPLKSDAPSNEPPATPVVQPPFAQQIWDNPTRTLKSLKSEALSGVASILTPNPATPFNQYEWRATARVQLSLKSDSYFGAFPLYSPNPTAPFNQLRWEGAAKPDARATGEALGGDTPLLTPNPEAPFNQDLWEGAAAARARATGDAFVNLLPVQTVVVVGNPFAQGEWYGAAKRASATEAGSYDVPSPIRTPNPEQPFGQDVWDSATRGRAKAEGEAVAGVNALLNPNPAQPFSQSDWLRLPGLQKAKVDDFVNLRPSQVVVVVAPFFQSEWVAAARRPDSLDAVSYPGDALLFPNPSQPFSQGIWDSATKALPKAIGEPNNSAPIFFQSNQQPFSQSDWPNPQGFATRDGTWINNGLFDGGTPPEPPQPDFPPHETPPENNPVGIRSGTKRRLPQYRTYRLLNDKEIRKLTGTEIREAARDLRNDVREDPLAPEVKKEVEALARIAAVLSDIDRLEKSVAVLTRAIEFAVEQRAKAQRDDDDSAILLMMH